jgi:hypothetical protein
MTPFRLASVKYKAEGDEAVRNRAKSSSSDFLEADESSDEGLRIAGYFD